MEDPKNQPLKWYFSTASLVTVFLCVGPLVLPLIWFNPRFNAKRKTLLTAVIIALSILVAAIFVRSLKYLADYYKMLDSLLKL